MLEKARLAHVLCNLARLKVSKRNLERTLMVQKMDVYYLTGTDQEAQQIFLFPDEIVMC
jgi:hypothetical protein